MSALIPVGSTFRKLALDLMRNSDTVDVKQLKKLWKVFEDSNNPMPAAVESEFRRVANAMEAPKISRQIAIKRNSDDRYLYGPSTLPEALDSMAHPRIMPTAKRIESHRSGADSSRSQAELAKRFGLEDPSKPGRTSKTNYHLNNMQNYRHNATVERSEAELLEAIMNLFGDRL